MTRTAEPEDPAWRRVQRLAHAPPLALLFALGLAPFALLFPHLPAGPGHDPDAPAIMLWLGAALVGGLAGALEGTARCLYRTAGLVLAAGLLSIPVMRLILWFDLPFPHGLATLLALDGESALDAALYEIWLAAWLVGMGLLLGLAHLGGRALARYRRGPARDRRV